MFDFGFLVCDFSRAQEVRAVNRLASQGVRTDNQKAQIQAEFQHGTADACLGVVFKQELQPRN